MRLLFYSFNSYSDPDVLYVLKKMNIEFDVLEYDFKAPGHNKNQDDDFVEMFLKKYDASLYDAVFSIDYWPPVAQACFKANLKYIAWSYDCPFDLLYPEDTLALPNVYCFVFDKEQQKKYSDMGIDNIYYMPLGVNVDRYKKINSSDIRCRKYLTDISFVGKLYENSYPLIRMGVNANTANVLDKIIETQTMLLPNNVLDQLVTDGLVNVINSEMHANDKDFKDEATKGKIIYALESEITRKERITLLNLCGRRYRTDFYSNSKFDLLEGVSTHGYVNYWEEMPWIFAASKINLNPTLKAIHAGVSLRAFDITACGGFMLTSRLPELEELFADGKEVGIYDNVVDFVEKLEYYMSHDDERNKIAKMGRERCFRDHSMDKRLKEIFDISFNN
ncbi:MAG: glycosyltransferase [Lachnospiraceae bacterium]|nr:glycosyltransferase [Lachnospiraceae bacterium]